MGLLCSQVVPIAARVMLKFTGVLTQGGVSRWHPRQLSVAVLLVLTWSWDPFSIRTGVPHVIVTLGPALQPRCERALAKSGKKLPVFTDGVRFCKCDCPTCGTSESLCLSRPSLQWAEILGLSQPRRSLLCRLARH